LNFEYEEEVKVENEKRNIFFGVQENKNKDSSSATFLNNEEFEELDRQMKQHKDFSQLKFNSDISNIEVDKSDNSAAKKFKNMF
jgi:hypothetical protein